MKIDMNANYKIGNNIDFNRKKTMSGLPVDSIVNNRTAVSNPQKRVIVDVKLLLHRRSTSSLPKFCLRQAAKTLVVGRS